MKNLHIAAIATLSAFSIFSFFRVFDARIEIEDMRSQIRLQKESLTFLQSITDQSLKNCNLKVEDFEEITRSGSYAYSSLQWKDEHTLVGPFDATRNQECITEVRLIGLP